MKRAFTSSSTSSSESGPPEGAACEVAGNLIRQRLDRSRAPDARQWAAIQASLRGRRRGRIVEGWRWRIGGLILATSLAAVWLVLGSRGAPLSYVVDGCALGDEDGGGRVATTVAGARGRIAFSDGSRITLEGDTRGRIAVPNRSSSVALVLDRGTADLDVVHRHDTRWVVDAGPFHIDVKGTQFRVSWSPERRHFVLDLRQGEVAVNGGSLPTEMRVRAGEVLDVLDDDVQVADAAAPAHATPATNDGTVIARGGRPVGGGLVATERPGAPVRTEGIPSEAATEAATKTGPRSRDSVNEMAATAALTAPSGIPVFIASDGKLGGSMTGYAWVAAGAGSIIETPASCDARGCFQSTRGELCARGTTPALQCAAEGTCDWDTNWGAMIGMHTTKSGGSWQSAAPASVSIAYRGRDARAPSERGMYRLNVHVAGDPDSKVYCIDGYASGQVAAPSALRTDCWTESGETLDSFQRVDKLGLQRVSTESPTTFDYCVTAIAVNGTARQSGDGTDDSHVAIGSNGKLGGDMTGYAWVAGGSGAAFRAPSSCDERGCFRNTEGRLCAEGTVAPLACTGQGTSRLACDWQANWGAMIGLHANRSRDAWGRGAPATVALTFSGPAAVYRLVAHVAGTPKSEYFCVDGYESGRPIEARMLKAKCWFPSEESLTSFEGVDQIGLQLVSGMAPISFDVCISDIEARRR